MKVLITENKYKEIIKLSLINSGIQSTIENVGGWENFCKVMKIESPMDFLKSLPKMEDEELETRPGRKSYGYENGKTVFSYETEYKTVWVNYDEIWEYLRFEFNLDNDETKKIIKIWLSDVYNLDTKDINTFYDSNRKSY